MCVIGFAYVAIVWPEWRNTESPLDTAFAVSSALLAANLIVSAGFLGQQQTDLRYVSATAKMAISVQDFKVTVLLLQLWSRYESCIRQSTHP